jgi:phosphoribosylanthranilate isomerase
VRTRIKICGIREAAHARLAADSGADAIGFVFYRDSVRHIAAEDANAIARSLPPFVQAVGLFVDEPAESIRAILSSVHLDMLQFQGDEPPDFCDQFGKPWVRAVRVEPGVDLLEYGRRFSRAKALLLDAHVPGEKGGTGRTFDWSAVPRELPLPVVLSGGLTSENVGRAIRSVRPWGVDVSSGVERERGVKDPARIVEFIRSVRREDGST